VTQDLVDAANALAEVLTQQNAALSRLDFPAAAALGAAKEAAFFGVTRDCKLTSPVGGSPALAALGQRMKTLVTENQALLERAIAVQARIVGIIVRAAVPPPVTGQYAASGLKSQSRRTSAITLSARA
jgi:hypothetical protein